MNIPLKSIPEYIIVDTSTPTRPAPVVNGFIRLDQIKQKLAQYLSATYFGPAKSILLRAIRKQYMTTWPGLSVNLINKRLPKSMHTAKGYLESKIHKNN